ncbi:hypothetical protein MHK_002024 [Candidatus Magnetomorum sp. HK-1]|nr:hypothetical protein MHK_002024 [Candidatus Magnetomorum sp. HK-1]
MLIFDLKSEKPKIAHTEKQLLNSELYVRYLITMVKHHYDVDTDSVEYKRAIITIAKSVNKNATYSPNEKMSDMNSFLTKAVRVKSNKEATVNLGALLR